MTTVLGASEFAMIVLDLVAMRSGLPQPEKPRLHWVRTIWLFSAWRGRRDVDLGPSADGY